MKTWTLPNPAQPTELQIQACATVTPTAGAMVVVPHGGCSYGMMNADLNHNRRHTLHLQGYDYSQAGAYFVTICTKDRVCLFGEAVDGGNAVE